MLIIVNDFNLWVTNKTIVLLFRVASLDHFGAKSKFLCSENYYFAPKLIQTGNPAIIATDL